MNLIQANGKNSAIDKKQIIYLDMRKDETANKLKF